MRSRERGLLVTRYHGIFDLFKVKQPQPVSLTLAVRLELLRISSRILKKTKTLNGAYSILKGLRKMMQVKNMKSKSRGTVLRGGGAREQGLKSILGRFSFFPSKR
jgi:hypothetical protein